MAWSRIPTKPDPRINYCCLVCEKEFKLQQGEKPPKDVWDRIVCEACKSDIHLEIENLKRVNEDKMIDENHIRWLSREWGIRKGKIEKAIKTA